MTLRNALYEVAHQHQLDKSATHRLFQAAGFDSEPALLQRWFWRGMAALAAVLGGLGMIFWVAANWESLGRMGRFALLQGVVLTMGLAAAFRPRLRMPLGLLTLLCTGALLAYFGQTYQTGVDPWQLFALWAALGVFLCMGARSDVLWAPWALVAMTAISLWTFARIGHRWQVQASDFAVYGAAWSAAIAIVVALSPKLSRFTGAGDWAQRTAATLTIVSITLAGIFGLFRESIAPHSVLALALLAAATVLLLWRKLFDLFILSAVVLGINALLVTGFARLIFKTNNADLIGGLFLTGLIAAALLAASVSLITRLQRRDGIKEQQA